jgi:hypothetical protein
VIWHIQWSFVFCFLFFFFCYKSNSVRRISLIGFSFFQPSKLVDIFAHRWRLQFLNFKSPWGESQVETHSKILLPLQVVLECETPKRRLSAKERLFASEKLQSHFKNKTRFNSYQVFCVNNLCWSVFFRLLIFRIHMTTCLLHLLLGKR